jgi:signal transduction histidine kinase
MGYLYYKAQKEQIKKEKQNELLAIADLKVSQIANWRKERLGDAATIFDNFLLGPHVLSQLQTPKAQKTKGEKETLRWMKSFKAAYQYEDILLLDSNGTIRLSISQKKEVVGPETKQLLTKAIATKKIIFSDLYRSNVTGNIQLGLVVPIIAEEEGNSVAAGAMLLRMNPSDFLYPLIETWPTPSLTAETMLVRREGNEMVYLSDLRYGKDTALTFRLPISDPHLPVAMVARGKEGICEGVDYRGKEVLSAIRSIPDAPWFIVSKVDKEEVYTPLRGLLWNVMLLIGSSILLAGVGVVLIWRAREQEEQREYYQHLETTVKERTGELERANMRLEASYKDLESFSYSASHDLREPLMVIEWFSRNLLKKYRDKLDDDGKDMISVIHEKAGKMAQLIKDLLFFSRASTKEIQTSDIDMKALIQDVIEEADATIGTRNVQFESKDLPIAWGDPSMIRQVLVNLLSNALKYTRPRDIAKIGIGGIEKEGENIYYVRDNGIGFDEVQGDKLFCLFGRLHSSEEFEGTGIGLVITKRIIEKHGGRIWAEGKINEGATFYFSLRRKKHI